MKQETEKRLPAFRALALVALAALTVAGARNAARAQTPTPTPPWTQSGTNIVNTNTGNVGVGTANPFYKLEVQGAPTRNTMALIGDGDVVGYAGLKIGVLTTTGLAANRASAFNLVMRKDACFGGDGSGPSFVIESITKTGGYSGPFMIAPNNDVILNGGACVSGMSVGRVGIGTTAPGANLDVKGGNLAVRATVTGTTGANGKFQLFSSDMAGNPFGEMQLYAPSGAGSEYLRFNIGNSSGTLYPDALAIGRTGYVGVGTASPASLFEVRKDQTTGTEIRVSNANTSGFAGVYLNGGFSQAAGGFLQWNNGGVNSNLFVATGGAAPLHLGTNNTPRLTVASNTGFVGIGTGGPNFKLDVQGGQINASNGLCIAGVCKGSWSEVGGGTSGPWATGASGISYVSGRVGIGTDNPAQQLHVMNASTAVATVESSGAAAAAMQFKNLSRQWVVGAGLLTGGGDFSVHDSSAGATRMYVDASGKVGVGTTSPEQTLHVNGPSEILSTGPGAGLKFRNRGSATSADDWVWYSANNVARFYRAGQGDLLNVMPDGRLGLGTSNPSGKFEVAGGSVFFGDMGQTGWGNMIVRGRVLSASANIHLSPPGGSTVYINSDYREAGGAAGAVNLEVSGTITGGNIQAKYQDVAEWVPSTQRLAAGTVVVLDTDKTNHVLASTKAYDTGVAGVISEMPGVILGEGGDDKLKVATTGRVKVRVDATRSPVKVGDLLVTSDVEGVAMKSVEVDLGGVKLHRPGTIVGKALEPLEKGVGEILVLLSLQ